MGGGAGRGERDSPVFHEFSKTVMTMRCYECFNSRTTPQKVSELSKLFHLPVLTKQHSPNTKGRKSVFKCCYFTSPMGNRDAPGGGSRHSPWSWRERTCRANDWLRILGKDHCSDFSMPSFYSTFCTTGQSWYFTTQVVNHIYHS
ncbi:unnamed protein product, partial [Bubo scandiacus]